MCVFFFFPLVSHIPWLQVTGRDLEMYLAKALSVWAGDEQNRKPVSL